MNQQLFQVPCSQPWESPSSWVSRSALAQGVSPKDFLDYLGVDANGDVDVNVVLTDQERLRDICGLPEDHLALARLLLQRLIASGADTKRFLLGSGKAGAPRFRYCPLCLHSQRVWHLPVHWRFSGFRYCKLHHCLLEDRCHKCNRTLAVPTNQLTAGPDGQGVAYLKNCMSCGADLRHATPFSTRDAFSLLSVFEKTMLDNGIAVVAALRHGHLYKQGARKEQPLRTLRALDKQRLLPHQDNWLTVASLRGRLAQRLRRRSMARSSQADPLNDDFRDQLLAIR